MGAVLFVFVANAYRFAVEAFALQTQAQDRSERGAMEHSDPNAALAFHEVKLCWPMRGTPKKSIKLLH